MTADGAAGAGCESSGSDQTGSSNSGLRRGIDTVKKRRGKKRGGRKTVEVVWCADGTTQNDRFKARRTSTTILRDGRAALKFIDGRDEKNRPVEAALYGQVYRILVRPPRRRRESGGDAGREPERRREGDIN
jgi:hypothetical protein